MFPFTANSLLSMNAMVPLFSDMLDAGGYHVTIKACSIGVELGQVITKSALAGCRRQTRAQTPLLDVTATRMITRGARTAVSLLRNPNFL